MKKILMLEVRLCYGLPRAEDEGQTIYRYRRELGCNGREFTPRSPLRGILAALRKAADFGWLFDPSVNMDPGAVGKLSNALKEVRS